MKHLSWLFLLFLLPQSLQAKPSLEERKNLKFQITAFGGIEYSRAVSGASLGYFLEPDSMLFIRHSHDDDTTINEQNGTLQRVKLNVTAIGYRKFVGNSFNFTPIIYHRRSSSDVIGYQFNPALYLEDAGAGLKLGNEWQTDYFTYGCDWFGANHTVLKFHETVKASPKIRRLTFTFLNIYYGLSF